MLFVLGYTLKLCSYLVSSNCWFGHNKTLFLAIRVWPFGDLTRSIVEVNVHCSSLLLRLVLLK